MQLNSKELYQSSGKEKENRCLAFTSSAKRENRKYHVVVVQRRQRNVLKKRDARAKLLFYLSLFSSFCLSPCRRRRCCSSSLTVFCRMQIAMIQFAVRRKTRYNLHTLWLTHTYPLHLTVWRQSDWSQWLHITSVFQTLSTIPAIFARTLGLKGEKQCHEVSQGGKHTSDKICQLMQEIAAEFVFSGRQKMKNFSSSRR